VNYIWLSDIILVHGITDCHSVGFFYVIVLVWLGFQFHLCLQIMLLFDDKVYKCVSHGIMFMLTIIHINKS